MSADLFAKIPDMKEGQTATRTLMADSHLAAAYILAAQAEHLEAQWASGPSAEMRARRHAAVSGAVVLAAAFLEGFVNELLAEIEDPFTGGSMLMTIPRPGYRRLAALWSHGLVRAARHQICDKYQLMLLATDHAAFETGAKLYQQAKLVCRLRNELVHLSPVWVVHAEAGDGDDHTMTKALHGLFPTCPFAGPEDPWFPDRCLGAGCARWAADSALTFVRAFVERLGVPDAGLRLKYRLPALESVAVDPSDIRWMRDREAANS